MRTQRRFALGEASPAPTDTPRRAPRLIFAAALVVAGVGWLAASPPAFAAGLSPKSVELVDHRCVGDLAEDDLTLFANGTVRLRERIAERSEMLLAELERSELDGFLNRLLDIDLSEAESLRSGITGEWISQCGLTLALPDRATVFFRYGRFDVLPHSLETVRQVLGEVEALARTRAVHGTLPKEYEPKLGDFVRRNDGELFEVVGFTSDGKGIELNGINQPVTIYVARADFRGLFVAKENRALLDLER